MISAQQVVENEAALLRLVRAKGGLSRVDLARELRLSPSTVGTYVDRLVGAGYLREGARVQSADRGRPATRVVLDPAGGAFLGLDVTRRLVRAVVLDFAETVTACRQHRVDPGTSFAAVMKRLLVLARECRARDRRRLLGMGLCLPAVLTGPPAAMACYPHLRDWDLDVVRETLTGVFGLPLCPEPSIRAMAAAELWHGCGRDVDNFVCLGVRTGVGAVPVLAGEPVVGAAGRAGDIGCWRPPFAAETLAELASLPGLLGATTAALRGARAGQPDEPDLGEVVRAWQAGEDAVVEPITRAGRALGWAAARVSEVIDPRLVVLAGPLTNLGESFAEVARGELARQLPGRTAPPLLLSGLGTYGAAIGAAAVGLHHWRPDR